MYSIPGYGRMIADQSRLASYIAAIEKAVGPDSIVADIGTGPGVFALMACRAGARRVYAIEPDNVIQVAREEAVANGFADRIEFIQDLSTRVTLPERADVIISDLRGVLPWFQHHLPSVRDARTRLLAAGGILIAKRDSLWAAAVEVDDTYAKLVAPWNNDKHKLSLKSALRHTTNSWSKTHLKPQALLSAPVCWHTLDYSEFEQSSVQATIDLSILRPGITHGFAVWFDCEVLDGINFSNAPGNDDSIYGNAFFPFPQPVEVSDGSEINIRFRADLVGQDYVWGWDTTISNPENKSATVSFKQSTLFGTPLSAAQLKKRAATFVPNLSSDGRLDYFILSRIDGKSSIEEIATELMTAFPARFEKFDEALSLVAEISIRYGE